MSDWCFCGETVHVFWSQKRSSLAISHYVFIECRPSTVSYGIAMFVVRNHREWPFLGSKHAPFCCKNASVTNGARFTHIPPPPPPQNGVFQTVFFRFLTSARDRGKPRKPVFRHLGAFPSALADPGHPLNTPL